MEKTFWIQGRTGRYWQNLESLESDKAVIVRLGSLIGEDRYDELRLIQAHISQITGETVFKTIVTIKDGQVIDSALPNAQGLFGIRFADEQQAQSERETPLAGQRLPHATPQSQPAEPVSRDTSLAETTAADGLADLIARPTNGEDGQTEHHPQLRFWPTPKPENLQGQLSLNGETNWIQDTQAAIAEEEGVHPDSQSKSEPLTTDEVVDQLVAEWQLPGVDHREGNQPYFESSAPNARRETRQSSDQRDGSNARRPRRTTVDRRLQNKSRRAKDRSKKRASTAGRAALMSGVFAGALATGLAISAISPDFAGRFFAGISGQITDILPKTDLVSAVATGDIQSVRARLAEGVDPNSSDQSGSPALLIAAQAENLAAVSLLLQAGADPTAYTPDGISILHALASEGRSQALARMLDAGAPVDLAGGQYGCLTPLSVAAASGRVRVASILAERGASLSSREGCTAGPMEIAAAHPHVFTRLEQIRAERDAYRGQASGQDDVVPQTEAEAIQEPDQSTVTFAQQALSAASSPSTGSLLLGASLEDQQEVPGEAAQVLESATNTIDESGENVSLRDQVAAVLPSLEQEAGSDAEVFLPPSKPPPPPVLQNSFDPRVFSTRLRSAIDAGEQNIVVALLGDKPAGFALDDARYTVEDSFGSGVRTALEHAALSGRSDIVRLLAGDGATVAPKLVHQIVQHADRPLMTDVLSVLLEQGANPNALVEGLTPLMRASLKGDLQTAYMLMAFGADPSVVSTDGRLASDFARDAGRSDLEERLVLASREPDYSELMMGLSWSDTLATMRDKVEVCKDLGDDFTACKLDIPTWMEDAKSVIAQFDRKASDRLVALQIDSRPISSVPSAIARFDAARRAIQAKIPAGHNGFLTTEIQDNQTLFTDLRPEVNRARYFTYWPDEDRRRPVFVHLKLNGLNEEQGFYRIVIGNPFRAS